MSSGPFSFAAANDARPIGGGDSADNTCVVLQSVGTWGVNTLVVEGSQNGQDWVTLMGKDLTAGTDASSITATGKMVRFDLAGIVHARVRCSVYASGDAPVIAAYGRTGVRA